MRRLCNIVKPLSDFHVNNSNADKHDTRCKTCCQGYEREKRAKKHRILEPTVAEKTCRCAFRSGFVSLSALISDSPVGLKPTTTLSQSADPDIPQQILNLAASNPVLNSVIASSPLPAHA